MKSDVSDGDARKIRAPLFFLFLKTTSCAYALA